MSRKLQRRDDGSYVAFYNDGATPLAHVKRVKSRGMDSTPRPYVFITAKDMVVLPDMNAVKAEVEMRRARAA